MKKGMTFVNVIVLLIIGLAVLFLALVLVRKQLTAQNTLGEQLDLLDDKLCLNKGYLNPLSENADKDKDKRADGCDICLCKDNKCGNGLTSHNGDDTFDGDQDGDGIPDGCDANFNHEDPKAFSSGWIAGCTNDNECNGFTDTGYCLRKIGKNDVQCYFS
jgi:hypothetical protein